MCGEQGQDSFAGAWIPVRPRVSRRELEENALWQGQQCLSPGEDEHSAAVGEGGAAAQKTLSSSQSGDFFNRNTSAYIPQSLDFLRSSIILNQKQEEVRLSSESTVTEGLL